MLIVSSTPLFILTDDNWGKKLLNLLSDAGRILSETKKPARESSYDSRIRSRNHKLSSKYPFALIFKVSVDVNAVFFTGNIIPYNLLTGTVPVYIVMSLSSV